MKSLNMILCLGLAAIGSVSAPAQSFNIDLDIGVGDATIGNGAPSSAFPGAAGQAGFWNTVTANGPHNLTALFGLDGGLTGVHMQATGGIGGALGYNNPLNTGDYALLLNDSADVGNEVDYHFSGLIPGHYLIYTYAVKENPPNVRATVTVPGATIPVQTVAGPMPGNTFMLGVTHSVHDLQQTGTSFEIEVSGSGPPNPQVNGFQIVAVPEPATLSAFSIGLIFLRRRKRPV